MALTNSEKNEIEVMIRKEIKSFLSSNTVNQFEDKLIKAIQKEIKNGKIQGDVKDIVLKMLREFYHFMWSHRNFWETKIKNA
jgi:anti-sigma28 factor (negative regulator of flagellin synthesis)